MAQTKQQIQAMPAGPSTSPRHRFGQNFMIDRNLVALVAEAGQIAPADLVIEVGPGTGTLTEELLARSQNVIAVEIHQQSPTSTDVSFDLELRATEALPQGPSASLVAPANHGVSNSRGMFSRWMMAGSARTSPPV